MGRCGPARRADKNKHVVSLMWTMHPMSMFLWSGLEPAEVLVLCSGWWFCQYESKNGWIPAAYLEPLDGPEEAEDSDPNYEGKLLVS